MRKLLFIVFYFIVANTYAQSIKNLKGMNLIDNICYQKGASVKMSNLLNSYLRLVIGKDLRIQNSSPSNSIVLQIGTNGLAKSLFDNCEPDAYYLGTKDKDFYIIGNSSLGLEYGIYEFLEQFGKIYWLYPGDNGLILPNKSVINLPNVSKVYNPAFKSRQLSPLDVNGGGDINNWARISRVNSTISFHHNMNFFIKTSNPKELDADIFPIYSNKRYIPRNDSDIKWQPNFASDKFLKFSTNKVLKYFAESSSPTFSLGINDNFLVADNMRGAKNSLNFVSYSTQYYSWVKNLVSNVNKRYPNKKYGLLAYYNVANPPEFKLPDNVVPFITYERIRWQKTDGRSFDKNLTSSWSRVASELGWYDYLYGYTYLIPRPYSKQIAEYLKWANQNHVKYFYGEVYPNWGEGPKYWVLTKLLWDPSLDPNQLENTWYIKAVGEKSAPYLKAYFKIWEDYWSSVMISKDWFATNGTFLPFNDLGYLKYITSDSITESEKNLQLALENANTKQQKTIAKMIFDMWGLYKTAILEYKSNNYKSLSNFKGNRLFLSKLNELSKDPIHQFTVTNIKNNMK